MSNNLEREAKRYKLAKTFMVELIKLAAKERSDASLMELTHDAVALADKILNLLEETK